MTRKPFNRDEALGLLDKGCNNALLDYDLRDADLRNADMRNADLRDANLRNADMRGANLDFSCWPLWCGGLHVRADKRIAVQLVYHLCSLQCDDEEFVKMRNSILEFANQFHRVDECGELNASGGVMPNKNGKFIGRRDY